MKALPTLLHVGLAEVITYRLGTVVWMLSMTMPLIMLAVWMAIVGEGEIAGFGRSDFVAYYLAAFIVRSTTTCWVVWQMNIEIRSGLLGLRLLRPVSPFVCYLAAHIGAVPLRCAIALPVAVVLFASSGDAHLPRDPVVVALVPVALALAWGIVFAADAAIGSSGLFVERSMALADLWMAAFGLMSGFILPLDVLEKLGGGWVKSVGVWLPFRYMLGFPVEMVTGMADRDAALRGVGAQIAVLLVLSLVARTIWRAGLKRLYIHGG